MITRHFFTLLLLCFKFSAWKFPFKGNLRKLISNLSNWANENWISMMIFTLACWGRTKTVVFGGFQSISPSFKKFNISFVQCSQHTWLNVASELYKTDRDNWWYWEINGQTARKETRRLKKLLSFIILYPWCLW